MVQRYFFKLSKRADANFISSRGLYLIASILHTKLSILHTKLSILHTKKISTSIIVQFTTIKFFTKTLIVTVWSDIFQYIEKFKINLPTRFKNKFKIS